MKGIICKVWNIKGNVSSNKKSTSSQVKDSISYILNDEKTRANLKMTGSPINDPASQIERECQYIDNDIKTVNGALVGVHNLNSSDVRSAVLEMMKVKEFYGKLDGRAALHGVISIDSSIHSVNDASKLLQLCRDVMKEVFPDNQAIFAVHTNTDNLHVHFIVNSVGLNGKKIHQDKNFVKDILQPCVNKYAAKYGFPINEEWQKKHKNDDISYTELKIRYKNCIDESIEVSETFDEFLDSLRNKNISVSLGKYLSLRFNDSKKAIRTSRLGYNYSIDMIADRIRSKREPLVATASSELVTDLSFDKLEHQPYRKMKRYADMSADEKKEAIAMLRKGLNPWRIHSKRNWQLNNFIDQENEIRNAAVYINNYAPHGTLADVKKELLRIRSILKNEKKELRLQKLKYKPIIDIYVEMKSIEKKSYLYEHEGRAEYKDDYLRYRSLTKKLRTVYDKDVYDVSAFLKEYENKYDFINGQLDEIYKQYAEVNRLSNNPRFNSIDTETLRGFIGYDEALNESKFGVISSDTSFVISDNSGYILKVEKMADINQKGRAALNVKLTVIDKNGNTVDSISSMDNGYMFVKKMNELSSKYGFNGHMKKLDSSSKAFSMIIANTAKASVLDSNEKTEHNKKKPHCLTFTQAVNVDNENVGISHYIVSASDPENGYFRVTPSNGQLDLDYFDKNNNLVISRSIPSINNKNSDGWKTLQELSKTFGFIGQSSICFSSIDEYRKYIDDENRQKAAEQDKQQIQNEKRHI